MPGFELFGEAERKEVMEVLETGILMRYGFDGPRKGRWKARELEAALCLRLGSKYAHVCSSGTAALATAMAACGIGAGDEVIVPPFTFVADIEMILLAGAIPVFAEIDETLTLDPKSVERCITPRTRAVVAVHMCGAMARMEALLDICRNHKVILIEDAAQALGATYKGRSLGTMGKAGILSFDFVKTVTCGEGGGIITNDPDILAKCEAYTDHGHDHLGADRGADLHPCFGANYRISELHAAVGLAQIRKLDAMLETQRRHKRFLKDGLEDIDRLTFRDLPDPDGDSATFLAFMLPTEGEARACAKELSAAGVDGCFYWYDNNWHYHRRWDHLKQLRVPGRIPGDVYEFQKDWAAQELPQSDDIMSRTICMLLKLSWTPRDLERRLQLMQSVLGATVAT